MNPEATSHPEVSVIIPTFNGRHLLESCLPSLFRQNYTGFEVIVVDNGSSDGTEDYLKKEFPQVRGFYFKEQLYFAKAANAGIRSARGDYIVMLNNDTEVDPDWLQELKAVMDREPDLGSVASKMLDFDKRDILDGAGDLYVKTGMAYRFGWSLPDSPAFQKPMRLFGACGGAAMYRKSLLETIGLFDEDFKMYYEDVDLNFRAQLYGYPCQFVPTARLYHKGSAPKEGEKSQNDADILYLISRNSLWTVLKNYPLALLTRNFRSILRSRYQHARAYYQQSRELGWAYTKGILHAILKCGPILKKRWLLQSQTRPGSSYFRHLFQQSDELMKIDEHYQPQ